MMIAPFPNVFPVREPCFGAFLVKRANADGRGADSTPLYCIAIQTQVNHRPRQLHVAMRTNLSAAD